MTIDLAFNTSVEVSVIGQTVEPDLKQIVHASSITATYNPGSDSVNEQSPPL